MELTIDRLTKQYKNKIAVDRLSFSLTKGVTGLLGANGAGKTTLIRMLCGILVPTSGEITYNGISVSDEHYRNVLGYLPQEFGYYPEFTGKDFLMYFAALKGFTKKAAEVRVNELLELVGLSQVQKKKIKTYSGGMKQRLGIAQALINRPEVLILDEPTAGLDPKERVRFRNLIDEIGKESIVLLSTHIVSDIEYIANNIMLMKDGELFYAGTAEDLVSSMKEKVWQCNVSRSMIDKYMNEYLVGNIKTTKTGAELRIISIEKPTEDAVAVEKNLEDAFLFYFGEKSEEKQDA